MLQEKYFKKVDLSIPIFAFIGRVTEQKGVQLILDCTKQLIHLTNSKIQILVGGPCDPDDPYANLCSK